jgi:hypothetical protein
MCNNWTQHKPWTNHSWHVRRLLFIQDSQTHFDNFGSRWHLRNCRIGVDPNLHPLCKRNRAANVVVRWRCWPWLGWAASRRAIESNISYVRADGPEGRALRLQIAFVGALCCLTPNADRTRAILGTLSHAILGCRGNFPHRLVREIVTSRTVCVFE